MSNPKKLCWWLLTWWGISTVVMLLGLGFLGIVPWVPITDAAWQAARAVVLTLFFIGGLICAWIAFYKCLEGK